MRFLKTCKLLSSLEDGEASLLESVVLRFSFRHVFLCPVRSACISGLVTSPCCCSLSSERGQISPASSHTNFMSSGLFSLSHLQYHTAFSYPVSPASSCTIPAPSFLSQPVHSNTVSVPQSSFSTFQSLHFLVSTHPSHL